MTTKRQKKNPHTCPKCGSIDIVPIFYGLPGGPDVMEAAEQGKIALGGCCVTDRDPQKQCNSCGMRFDLRPPLSTTSSASFRPLLNAQTVGNIGLYFVCYRLSRAGWNVMPTSRNARGIDLVAYSQDAARTHTFQVKALSGPSPVPLGSNLGRFFGDFVVICRKVVTDAPECFVLTPEEVRNGAHRGEKEGRVSFWLQPRDYAREEFREAWHRIGSGHS